MCVSLSANFFAFQDNCFKLNFNTDFNNLAFNLVFHLNWNLNTKIILFQTCYYSFRQLTKNTDELKILEFYSPKEQKKKTIFSEKKVISSLKIVTIHPFLVDKINLYALCPESNCTLTPFKLKSMQFA